MNTISERIFNRQILHSEASRQEYIGKKAKSIEKDIYAALMSDDAEADEIGECVASFMSTETMRHMVRCTLSSGPAAAGVLRQLMLIEIDAAVKRTAELRAIRHVEAMTPEEFNND
jgi:hypothetical protein